jgi:hypothetical protein
MEAALSSQLGTSAWGTRSRKRSIPRWNRPRRAGKCAVRWPMTKGGFMFAHEHPPLAKVTTKARPPVIGGRAALLRLRPNGNSHESATCSPSRQVVQAFGLGSNTGLVGVGFACALGVVSGGWARACPPLLQHRVVRSSWRRFAVSGLVVRATLRKREPNPSVKRTA